MWSFLWLVDSSDASFCHSNPPHSGTDLHSPPLPALKHCDTPRVHVSPPMVVLNGTGSTPDSAAAQSDTGAIKVLTLDSNLHNRHVTRFNRSTSFTAFFFLFKEASRIRIINIKGYQISDQTNRLKTHTNKTNSSVFPHRLITFYWLGTQPANNENKRCDNKLPYRCIYDKEGGPRLEPCGTPQ